MLKWIGAAFILIAGTMLGFGQARRYTGRPQQIRMLINALQQLETEIMYGHTPLPEALDKIGRNAHRPVGHLIAYAATEFQEASGRPTAEVWRDATGKIWPETDLGSAEKDIWIQLGSHLGATDREDQIKHLRLAMRQLQHEEQDASETAKQYGKMWKSLGVLAALLVVIMMY